MAHNKLFLSITTPLLLLLLLLLFPVFPSARARSFDHTRTTQQAPATSNINMVTSSPNSHPQPQHELVASILSSPVVGHSDSPASSMNSQYTAPNLTANAANNFNISTAATTVDEEKSSKNFSRRQPQEQLAVASHPEHAADDQILAPSSALTPGSTSESLASSSAPNPGGNSASLASVLDAGGSSQVLTATSGPSPSGNSQILSTTSSPNPGGNAQNLAVTSGPNPGGNSQSLAASSGPSPRGNSQILSTTSSPNPGGNAQNLAAVASGPNSGGNSQSLASTPAPNPGSNSQSLTTSSGPNPGGNSNVLMVAELALGGAKSSASGTTDKSLTIVVDASVSGPNPGGNAEVLSTYAGPNPGRNSQILSSALECGEDYKNLRMNTDATTQSVATLLSGPNPGGSSAILASSGPNPGGDARTLSVDAGWTKKTFASVSGPNLGGNAGKAAKSAIFSKLPRVSVSPSSPSHGHNSETTAEKLFMFRRESTERKLQESSEERELVIGCEHDGLMSIAQNEFSSNPFHHSEELGSTGILLGDTMRMGIATSQRQA